MRGFPLSVCLQKIRYVVYSLRFGGVSLEMCVGSRRKPELFIAVSSNSAGVNQHFPVSKLFQSPLDCDAPFGSPGGEIGRRKGLK